MSDFDLFHCILNAYEQVLWQSKSHDSDVQVPLIPFQEIWSQTPVEIYSPVDEIMLPDLIWDDFVIQMNETKKINETPVHPSGSMGVATRGRCRCRRSKINR